MIGDEYFQLRAQIGTSLYSLDRLAHELSAPEETLAGLQTLQAGLRDPFLFLTIGGTGVGKSSLLNALFGREFAGGTDGQTVVFRHGNQAQDLPLQAEVVEAQRPHIFLRDFTVVETTIAEKPVASSTLESYLAGADLIFFVFAGKGSVEGTWDFLSKLDRETLRRLVFVIQRSDLSSENEMLLTVKKLRHTMLNRLAQACPIFNVSAQTGAGLEKLRQYVDCEVIASARRCRKMTKLCEDARSLLHSLSLQPKNQVEAAERKADHLAEHREALAERKDQSLRQAGGELWTLAQIVEAAQRRGDEILRRRLTLVGLMTDGGDWSLQLDREIEDRLRESVHQHLGSLAGHLRTDLAEAWQEQRVILRRLGGTVLPEFDDRAALTVERLDHTFTERDPQGITVSEFRAAWASVRSMLRLPMLAVVGLFAVLLGTTLAWQFLPTLGGFTVFVVLIAGFQMILARRNLLGTFQLLMNRRRANVLAGIEDQIRGEIDRFYRELAITFRPLEEASSRQKAQAEPTQARISQLGELFTRCITGLSARQTKPAPMPEPLVTS